MANGGKSRVSPPRQPSPQRSEGKARATRSKGLNEQSESSSQQIDVYQRLLRLIAEQPEPTHKYRKELWEIEFEAGQAAISALRLYKELHSLKTSECKRLSATSSFWRSWYLPLQQMDNQLEKAFWTLHDVTQRTGAFTP